MKVHITEAKVIVGKDKREWLKISFVKPSGETGSGILPAGVCKIPEVDLNVEELLKYKQTDVVFDDRGRVVDILG